LRLLFLLCFHLALWLQGEIKNPAINCWPH
jgi:hypothetical protein